MAAGTDHHKSIRIETSPDRLQAHVDIRADRSLKEVTEQDLCELLKAKGIVVNDSCREHINELAKLLQSASVPGEPFLVAQGTAPVEPVDAEFVWDEALKQDQTGPDDSGAVNFYERHKLVTVEAGVAIGKIVAPQPGKDGVDVYGKPAKPKRSPVKIRVGENVELDEETQTVRSKRAGQVIFEKGKVSVRSSLEVPGDIDFGTGNVDAASDILIRGSVHDLFIVKSKRTISVQGMVESAYLFAGGNITIVGGVKGRDKAIMEAAGDVNAKFLDSVYLIAGGDVNVAKEAIDNNIICGGSFDIRHGVIIGGRQFVMGDIRAKVIGSQADVKTVVGTGCDPRRSRSIIEIKQKIEQMRKLAEKIRLNVDPLLKQMKRLTANQREKATELMYKASALEQKIADMDAEKQEIVKAFPDITEVQLNVTSKIYPNTVIIIANKFLVIKEEVKGPVKITLRKVEGVTEMLLINGLTGSIRTLPAQAVGLEQLQFAARPEIAQPGTKPQEQADQSPAAAVAD